MPEQPRDEDAILWATEVGIRVLAAVKQMALFHPDVEYVIPVSMDGVDFEICITLGHRQPDADTEGMTKQ